MNEPNNNEPADADLSQLIKSLEAEPWLKQLQGLQPQVESQRMFDLGFAAGKQSVGHAGLFSRQSIQLASLSSLVSMAASVLLMWQWMPGPAPSTLPGNTPEIWL